MEVHEGPCIAAALAARMRNGVPAVQVATDVARIWRQVEASLVPIIGPAGVAALYRRSVVLAGRSHPWVTELCGESPAIDIAALTAVLALREGNTAALGGGELLETFYRLLAGVIGPALARRLLPFMWQPLDEPELRTSP